MHRAHICKIFAGSFRVKAQRLALTHQFNVSEADVQVIGIVRDTCISALKGLRSLFSVFAMPAEKVV